MSLQTVLIIGALCACIALLGSIWIWMQNKHISFSDTDEVTIQFPNDTIRAEVAVSFLKHAAGLSMRPSLDANKGMLFVFNEPQRPTFWMKGMKFPLDFVWIQNNVVIEIHQNISEPKHIFDFTTIQPKEKITMVLEVRAGTIETLKIHVGDIIQITK